MKCTNIDDLRETLPTEFYTRRFKRPRKYAPQLLTYMIEKRRKQMPLYIIKYYFLRKLIAPVDSQGVINLYTHLINCSTIK